jgi:hypothetical protein
VLPFVSLLFHLAVAPPANLVVLPFAHADDVSLSAAETAQSIVAAALAREASLTVVSTADVFRMLELSVDRALLGCMSDDESCTTDVASALGATHLVTRVVERFASGEWIVPSTIGGLTLAAVAAPPSVSSPSGRR